MQEAVGRVGSRGLGYCSIFSGKKTGGKTEEGSPLPQGLQGISLGLEQGVGVPGGLGPRRETEQWEVPHWMRGVGGVAGWPPLTPPGPARTPLLPGPGVLVPTSHLYVVSPGQVVQNTHAHCPPRAAHVSPILHQPQPCVPATGGAWYAVLGPASLPLLWPGPDQTSNWMLL